MTSSASRDEAVHQEIKVAQSEQRLRVTAITSGILIFLLLLGTLVYAVVAAESAKDAARAGRVAAEVATEQSRTNKILLDRIIAAEEQRAEVLAEIKTAENLEANRFQMLLDTLFGANTVVLGDPAPARFEPAPTAPRSRAATAPRATTPRARPAPRSTASAAPPRETKPERTPVPQPLPTSLVTIPLPPQVPNNGKRPCNSIVCVR